MVSKEEKELSREFATRFEQILDKEHNGITISQFCAKNNINFKSFRNMVNGESSFSEMIANRMLERAGSKFRIKLTKTLNWSKEPNLE